MSETQTDALTFIRALVNAWDCCATCAGGVLAARDRERDALTRADEHARLADRLDGHVWHGGYFCQCGHELNSAGGWFRHLAGEDT